MKGPLTAVVWDYDGTLVDTLEKNFRVARRIVSRVSGLPADRYPALRSAQAYQFALRRAANWRELYRSEFDFSDDETDAAGSLWTGYQEADDTPTALFDGITEVLASLDGVPQGIVSQNASQTIAAVLEREAVAHYFRVIVGYEEVHLRRQKPAPDGLLTCVAQLTATTPGWVLYIGDHETDVRCALYANRELAASGRPVRVKSVGVHFAAPDAAEPWPLRPDYLARRPRDILRIIREAFPREAPGRGAESDA